MIDDTYLIQTKNLKTSMHLTTIFSIHLNYIATFFASYFSTWVGNIGHKNAISIRINVIINVIGK